MATVVEVYRALGKLIDKGKGDYTVVGKDFRKISFAFSNLRPRLR